MMKMMMCSQCITIGMNKKQIFFKESILFLLCFVIGIGIRLIIAFSGGVEVTDDMQFFKSSVIQEEQTEPVMTSGVACAYSESLSDVFRFAGNRMSVVVWYHILLQTFSFFFLFFGCSFLFGKNAALLESAVFAVSPWFIKGIFRVSPENFYLFWWTFAFFLIGIFTLKTREKGWYRKNTDEILLIFLGFLTGMICIWHSMGFFLLLFISYSFIVNIPFIIEKRNMWEKASVMESLLREEEDEKDDINSEIMPLFTQIIILISGIFLGAYVTLMKYTGITGMYIQEQFFWWMSQLYRFANGSFQDMELWLPLGLLITICAAAVFENILKVFSERKTEEMTEEKDVVSLPEDEKMEEKKENEQIKYLDNPLPLPKKHVKRTLDFAIDKEDDFDIEIKENDDFDI